jgi:hypothetical protein
MKYPRQLTATDMIFISAKQRGKPITAADLKDSDIMFDLAREEKLIDNDVSEYKNCVQYCKSRGYSGCQCNTCSDVI